MPEILDPNGFISKFTLPYSVIHKLLFASLRDLQCTFQRCGVLYSSVLLFLTEASLCTCQAISQCVGGPTQKLLSKSRLFTCPDDHNTLMVAAADESSSSVSFVWMPLVEKILF